MIIENNIFFLQISLYHMQIFRSAYYEQILNFYAENVLCTLTK